MDSNQGPLVSEATVLSKDPDKHVAPPIPFAYWLGLKTWEVTCDAEQ